MFLHINLEIIQRKARHRKIETTLRYDHVSDDMVKEYFEKLQSDTSIPDIFVDEKSKNENGIVYA